MPAGDPRHVDVARSLGTRSVELVREGKSATDQVGAAAILNALVVLSAIGGSTNAVIHLTAMARRLGHDLTLAQVDEASRTTPVLVDVEPSGIALMEDFDRAGGVPTVWRALGSTLDDRVVLASGETLGEVQARAQAPDGVIHTLSDPVDEHGAFRVVYGNLVPGGALIKRSAATPSLLSHRGPAYVIGRHEDIDERTGPDSACPEDAVLVMAGVGPIGGPGMPEWGMVPIPEPLLARGVTDMVRVTDARMSGTSFGTVFLHAAPEAAIGGPIGLVRDGDMIHVDADLGVLEVEVSDEELERRAHQWWEPVSETRGYTGLYQRHVSQAPDGCDFDFLVQPRGQAPRLDEPVVGRS